MSTQPWPQLITELNNIGLTQKEIADKVGCDQSHISDLKTGKRKEPRFSLGQRLIALHAERCAQVQAA